MTRDEIQKAIDDAAKQIQKAIAEGSPVATAEWTRALRELYALEVR